MLHLKFLTYLSKIKALNGLSLQQSLLVHSSSISISCKGSKFRFKKIKSHFLGRNVRDFNLPKSKRKYSVMDDVSATNALPCRPYNCTIVSPPPNSGLNFRFNFSEMWVSRI